jgi:hypothetical protein
VPLIVILAVLSVRAFRRGSRPMWVLAPAFYAALLGFYLVGVLLDRGNGLMYLPAVLLTFPSCLIAVTVWGIAVQVAPGPAEMVLTVLFVHDQAVVLLLALATLNALLTYGVTRWLSGRKGLAERQRLLR